MISGAVSRSPAALALGSDRRGQGEALGLGLPRVTGLPQFLNHCLKCFELRLGDGETDRRVIRCTKARLVAVLRAVGLEAQRQQPV